MPGSLREFILNGRVRDGEFIRKGFTDFAALTCFTDGCDSRHDDHSCRQHCHAPDERRDTIQPRHSRAPERDHAAIECKRHRDRLLFAHLCGRSQQPIDLLVLHLSSFAEIFASCCFIFCRARNARTLIRAAPQPVILRISSTERPCKSSNSIASRSTGLSAASRYSTSWRDAKRWSGASSPEEAARFSTTARSSSLKSACRNSGRTFSDSI